MLLFHSCHQWVHLSKTEKLYRFGSYGFLRQQSSSSPFFSSGQLSNSMEEGTCQQESHDVWECLISETAEAGG